MAKGNCQSSVQADLLEIPDNECQESVCIVAIMMHLIHIWDLLLCHYG